jgi:hypothetical protein
MDGFDKLELNTETLRELSSDQLSAVAGGAGDTVFTCHCPTIPPTGCITPLIADPDTIITCHCPR